MGRHDMSWRDFQQKTRMRYGLRWRKSYPMPSDFRDALLRLFIILLATVLVVLLFGYLDARDARIDAELKGDKASQQFADFLNGGALVDQAGRFAAKCERLIEVTQ